MSIAGALMELFGPEMDEYIDGRTREAVERGRVQQLIRTTLRHGAAEDEIIKEISQEFGCTEGEARQKAAGAIGQEYGKEKTGPVKGEQNKM